MSSTTPDRLRLFFALWPDPALQEEIWYRTRRLTGTQGQRVPACNLHITLAFLGAVSQAQCECYVRVAARILSQAFTLSLDRVGHWPRSRVLWLGPSRPPGALLSLVQNLNTALGACDFSAEARAYQPHMSVVRKVNGPCAVQLFESIDWAVASFALVSAVNAVDGLCYEILERWALSCMARDALCPD